MSEEKRKELLSLISEYGHANFKIGFNYLYCSEVEDHEKEANDLFWRIVEEISNLKEVEYE